MTVARVLRSFGHDVLAAGLAGGASGELIREDLARSGVPTAFTLIRGESRRFFRFASPEPSGPQIRFGEPGPYITTEELGRFAADYRALLGSAAAVVLCGSLPDGLPADTYGSLVTYAVEAGVPVILDVGGEELKHAVGHGPGLVVAETASADPGLGAALIRLGAGAAAVAAGNLVRVVTADEEWTAQVAPGPQANGTAANGIQPGSGTQPRHPAARQRHPAPRHPAARQRHPAPRHPAARQRHPAPRHPAPRHPGPRRAGGGTSPRPAARLVLAGPATARAGPGRRGLDPRAGGVRRPGPRRR